jgi:hypothetical protein
MHIPLIHNTFDKLAMDFCWANVFIYIIYNWYIILVWKFCFHCVYVYWEAIPVIKKTLSTFQYGDNHVIQVSVLCWSMVVLLFYRIWPRRFYSSVSVYLVGILGWLRCQPSQVTLVAIAAVNILNIKLEIVFILDSSRKPIHKFCDDFEYLLNFELIYIGILNYLNMCNIPSG